MDKKPEIVRYAYLKKQNRRITFSVWKINDEIVTQFEFKRLVGNWKERNIFSNEIGFTVTTTIVMKELLQLLFSDKEFFKLVENEISELSENKFALETDIANRTGNELEVKM